MNKLIKSIFFICVALLVSACQTIPPGWVLTGKANPGQDPQWIRYSNPSMIKVTGSIATMPSIMEYSTPRATERIKGGYRGLTIIEEYKCGERLSRTIEWKAYTNNNNDLVESSKAPEQSYKTIDPGTVGETEYNMACKDVRVSPPAPRPAPAQSVPQQRPQAPATQQRPQAPAPQANSSAPNSSSIDENGNKVGACFASIASKIMDRKPITSNMDIFMKKYNPINEKIASLIKGQCKGLSGTSANEPCFRKNLTSFELGFYVGFGSAMGFMNGPQDPQKLPNKEVANALCIGLI